MPALTELGLTKYHLVFQCGLGKCFVSLS